MESQLEAFEKIYTNTSRWNFLITDDKYTRYLIDRRLEKALRFLKGKYKEEELYNWSVLIVCGGVGGEGVFFLKKGFTNVTNSDFSENAVKTSKKLDQRLHTLVLDGEDLQLEEGAFDLVVVRDGLHHLPRPALGLTEMLRVAKKAVIVIEPYESLVGNMIGTEWEEHDGSVNYVFRWNRSMVNQVVKSYLLKKYDTIKVIRLWDHNVVMAKLSRLAPRKWKLGFSKIAYGFFSIFNFCGNMMVAIICKNG